MEKPKDRESQILKKEGASIRIETPTSDYRLVRDGVQVIGLERRFMIESNTEAHFEWRRVEDHHIDSATVLIGADPGDAEGNNTVAVGTPVDPREEEKAKKDEAARQEYVSKKIDEAELDPEEVARLARHQKRAEIAKVLEDYPVPEKKELVFHWLRVSHDVRMNLALELGLINEDQLTAMSDFDKNKAVLDEAYERDCVPELWVKIVEERKKWGELR